MVENMKKPQLLGSTFQYFLDTFQLCVHIVRIVIDWRYVQKSLELYAEYPKAQMSWASLR